MSEKNCLRPLFILAFLFQILSLFSNTSRQIVSYSPVNWTVNWIDEDDEATGLVVTINASDDNATNTIQVANRNAGHTLRHKKSHPNGRHKKSHPNARHKKSHPNASSSQSHDEGTKSHQDSFNFQYLEKTTTCKAREGLENRTLLPIKIRKEGGFPETQFTHHIRTAIVQQLSTTPLIEPCDAGFISFRQEKKTVVIEEHLPESRRNYWLLGRYTDLLKKRVFSEACHRRLPRKKHSKTTTTTTATIGFQSGDWSTQEFHNFHCFATGSSPEGIFHVFNFHAVRDGTSKKSMEMLDNIFSSSLPKVPWEERDPIPVWRGTLWGWDSYAKRAVEEGKGRTSQEVLDHFADLIPNPNRFFPHRIIPQNRFHHQRIPLVEFSRKHPDLLNAAGGLNDRWKTEKNGETFLEFIKNIPNSTLTSHDFFPPFEPIDKREYYSKYQVAVVMGGIGAAFRTADHLAMETAVILQDFPYQEWFYPYLTPFVDYIPLDRELSNLTEILHWVRYNPKKVKDVARNGRLFYERYLSYEKMEEYFYELVYRLTEAKIYNGIHLNIPESVMNLTTTRE